MFAERRILLDRGIVMRSITYCSFAGSEGCRGIIVCHGDVGVIEAAKRAHRLGINPGGEIMCLCCREGKTPKEIFEAMWNNVDRLIPVEEAKVLFDAVSKREYEASCAN
jgi:hypothetical protein